LLHARPELDLYRSGVAELENMFILPHGGITRRAGTVFASEVKDSAKKTRLVPFVFSTNDAYILEFGDFYIRFYKNGVPIMTSGDRYEISTPYSQDHLDDLSFAQSADYLFIDHPNFHPRQLTRVNDTDWDLEKSFLFDGPYDEIGFNENNNLGVFAEATLTCDAAEGSITITASGTGLTSFFVADDVDRVIRIYDEENNKWGAAHITSYTNALTVEADVFSGFPMPTTGSKTWRLGSWSHQHGWPSHVILHEQRLVHARTATYPNTVWGSRANDFVAFSPSDADGQVDDSHAYTYTLATGSIDDIRWMSSDRVIVCGTSNGPFSLGGADLNTPITPLSVRAQHEDALGCSEADPVKIGKSIVYIRKGNTGLIGLRYSWNDGGFVSQDISNFAEHLFRSGIYHVESALLPYYNVYGHNNSNRIYVMTLFPEQQVLAWAHYTIAGTDAIVESIAVVPDPTDTYSQLWMVVKRTINGQTKRYIEYLDKSFDIDNAPVKENAYFVDCGVKYEGTATNTVTGLDHLEGETVTVFADGSVAGDFVVENGKVTIGYEATKIAAGLKFASYMKSLPTEFVTDEGGTQHRIKRIDHVFLNIHNTMTGVRFGTSLDKLDILALRTTEDPMDDSPDLFTGSVELPFDGNYTRDPGYYIYQDEPVPLTIRSVATQLTVYGRP